MARVHLHTLGCRLNLAETESIARSLRLAGHEIVDDAASADLRVINTCTVTKAAGDDSRRAARRLHPDQKIAVTGCHSELHPAEFAAADIVAGNDHKEEFAALLSERFGRDGLSLGMDASRERHDRVYPLALGNTRAFVKIQDGCDMRCSFCLTTVARGLSRSRDPDAIVAEIDALHHQGCMEAVLTGVHAGSYGLDRALDLGALVDQILTRTGIRRLRLSSLEPWNFRDDWLELWSCHTGRLCRHLHMSLQSGSDSVLARMRRRYDAETFLDKVRLVKSVPGMAVTTDLIAGFPGESEEEHRRTLDVVREAAFAGAHVFAFSRRPGTEAATLPDQIPGPIRARRTRELKAQVAVSEAAFRRAAIGLEADVLWERKGANDDAPPGLTDNYLHVVACGFTPEQNQFSRVLLLREGTAGIEAVQKDHAGNPAGVSNGDRLPAPSTC